MGRALYDLRVEGVDWQVSADDFDLGVARVVQGAQMVEYGAPARGWTPFRATKLDAATYGLIRFAGPDPVYTVLSEFAAR